MKISSQLTIIQIVDTNCLIQIITFIRVFVMWKIERIIILFFALMLAFNLTIAGSVAAETIYVDDDGPADFPTIQAALNSASPGDEIVVRSGTYTENLDVDETDITIISESGNPFDTIVQAASSGDYVFHVTEDKVKISGFNIKGASGSSNGIYLEEVEYCLIENNELSENNIGIKLSYSSSNFIYNNYFTNNSFGIMLSNYYSNFIYNNCFNNTDNVRSDSFNLWNTPTEYRASSRNWLSPKRSVK